MESANPSFTANGESGVWRTLSFEELVWLLGPNMGEPNPGQNCRRCSTINGTSNARFALATVNGVTGLLIFPDAFTWTQGMGTAPQHINDNNGNAESNRYSSEDFAVMEAAGRAFLPAGGNRNGTSLNSLRPEGYYWTSVCDTGEYPSEHAWGISFGNNHSSCSYYEERRIGFTVGLVRNAD